MLRYGDKHVPVDTNREGSVGDLSFKPLLGKDVLYSCVSLKLYPNNTEKLKINQESWNESYNTYFPSFSPENIFFVTFGGKYDTLIYEIRIV